MNKTETTIDDNTPQQTDSATTITERNSSLAAPTGFKLIMDGTLLNTTGVGTEQKSLKKASEQETKKKGELRLKKDEKTPYLSNFDKKVRDIIKFNRKVKVEKAVESFTVVLNTAKPTLQELIISMIADGTIISEDDAKNIRLTKNGALNKTTLREPFRAKYKELEIQKKQEYEIALQEKFATPREFTVEELVKLNESVKKHKKPFSGKFKTE